MYATQKRDIQQVIKAEKWSELFKRKKHRVSENVAVMIEEACILEEGIAYGSWALLMQQIDMLMTHILHFCLYLLLKTASYQKIPCF